MRAFPRGVLHLQVWIAGFSEGLSRQLHPRVHVSIVEPGFIATPSALNPPRPNETAEEYAYYFDSSSGYRPNWRPSPATTALTDEVIAHALLDPRPRPRYVITSSRFVVYLFWMLPDWAADHVQRYLDNVHMVAP
jgi:hypothetical protein